MFYFRLVGKLFIVTLSLPLPTVLAFVATPELFITKPSALLILITTPDTGCVVGKLSSSAITSSPPTGAIWLATKSTTAPEVGK